ncbi:MAG: putative C-S lyase [Clostridiales bacterium]|nr:putative C-S lyase [Clostridiales bacterium]
MMYDAAFFDVGIDRANTCASKWSAPGFMKPGAIPLWVADMDFPVAAPIRDALVKRASHASYGYTYEDQPGKDALRGFWERRHGATFTDEESIMLPSVVSGLRTCVNALTQEGDGVIVLSPVYPPFFSTVSSAGRRVLEAPLIRDEQGRYHMDMPVIEAHMKAGARLLMLCSPHNPVSRLWSEQELDALFTLAIRYGTIIVSDEIHADFAYAPQEFISCLRRPEWASNAICLVAGSKTFNIAGLKQSWMICKVPALREKLLSWVRSSGIDCGNVFAMEANKAAFSQGDAWLDGLLSYLDGSRAIVNDVLAERLPRAVVTPIEATFLAWVDVRAYSQDNTVLMKHCFDQGVVPSDGSGFGRESGKGFLRVNFGCPRPQLTEGLHRLAAAVSSIS